MAVNQLKIVVSVLKEISDGNVPKASDYELENEAYWKIIDAMKDDGLIKGVSIARGGQGNKIYVAILDNATITIKGMEYLNNNSTLMKTYKGLKEVREWLPF